MGLLLQKEKNLYFHALKRPTNSKSINHKQDRAKNLKPNKVPWRPLQRLVGKDSRPRSHKLIVWNTQQNLKHTAEPDVLILPHCPQIGNYGHLCTTDYLSSQLSSSPRSLSLSVKHFPVSCTGIFDFFRLLTSVVTVDAPGAKRKDKSVLCPFHTLLRTANPEQKNPSKLYTDNCDT